MNKIERLFVEAENRECVYNVVPKKSCEVTFENFFNESKIKRHKSHNTKYVLIDAIFHELDGEKIQNQRFNLQIPLFNGFPPLYRLMCTVRTKRNVRVKLERTSKVLFNYTIMDTDNDTYIDIDTDTVVDTSKGDTMEMELRLKGDKEEMIK